MRYAALLVGVLACAACSGSRSRGPAWPKASAREADGGESLAPHLASSVAAIEKSDELKSEDKPAVKLEEPIIKPTTGGGSLPVTTPTPDEPITTEDIVIEIDD